MIEQEFFRNLGKTQKTMKKELLTIGFATMAILVSCQNSARFSDDQTKTAVFDYFSYSAEEVASPQTDDDITPTTPNELNNANCLPLGLTANPILPGCFPDPSICRAGEDYYLVNSSFAFFPGIPIWHSTDLNRWTRIGNVLNRPSQLQLRDGTAASSGIMAPDIAYNPHNKLFYVIVNNVNEGGSIFVTTDDPKAGNWSEPVALPDVGGIDQSFLFDDDGKAYIVNNDAPQGEPLYDGHRAIWIREFDWAKGQTTGTPQVIINGGVDLASHPFWIEGPHLYHIGDSYYLMAAEGGTGHNHSEVIFHATSPFGPFQPCPINPILTQRDLPDNRPAPVTAAGHADLVQTPQGDWYAVFLATRPYRGYQDVMGRETFMLPVTWENDQPIILPKGEAISYTTHPVQNQPLWTSDGLSPEAIFLRTPQAPFFHIDSEGRLILQAHDTRINEKRQPSAIGRWVTSNYMRIETALFFDPTEDGNFAGITLFHDDGNFITFGKGIGEDGLLYVSLSTCSNGNYTSHSVEYLQEEEANQKLYLQVKADGLVNYTFSFSLNPEGEWRQVGEPVSADMLSTETAGGFTGTFAGIYAYAIPSESPTE